MRKKILLTLISLIPFLTFGQKLESDGMSIEFKKYEVTNQEVPIFGKQTLIMGTFIIKKGNKKVAVHDFLVPVIKGELSHITALDSKGEKIFPRLHYVPSEKAYTYFEGTENEGKEIALKSDNQKEIVMSGLLIWAKLKYKK
jgi:hypothetical protein